MVVTSKRQKYTHPFYSTSWYNKSSTGPASYQVASLDMKLHFVFKKEKRGREEDGREEKEREQANKQATVAPTSMNE